MTLKLKKASNTTLLNPVSLDFGHNYFATVTINMYIVYQRVQSHSLCRDEQGDNGFSGTLRGMKQL